MTRRGLEVAPGFHGIGWNRCCLEGVAHGSRSPERRAAALEELAGTVSALPAASRRALATQALGVATSAADDESRETAIAALVLVDTDRDARVEESLLGLAQDARQSPV